MYSINLGQQTPTTTTALPKPKGGAGWAAAFGVLMIGGLGAAALGLYLYDRNETRARAARRLAWEHETAQRWA